MKTKLLTIAMTAALMLTAMTKVQAQNFEGPCLPKCTEWSVTKVLYVVSPNR